MAGSVLVCGGAGYIGSHMARLLAERGYDVTVFDNLRTGCRAAARWGDFVEGDLLDRPALDALFASKTFDAVFHFAALIAVGQEQIDALKKRMQYDANDLDYETHLHLVRDLQRILDKK